MSIQLQACFVRSSWLFQVSHRHEVRNNNSCCFCATELIRHVQTKNLNSCHFIRKQCSALKTIPVVYVLINTLNRFQASYAEWCDSSYVPYLPGPGPLTTCMDIKTLHIRPITTTHACYAHPKLAQARHRALGSVQRQPRRHVLVSRCSAGETNDAAPLRRDVGRMFQQHKLLMDSGFSYDQASLILEITERRAAPQPADAGALLECSLATAAAAACCRRLSGAPVVWRCIMQHNVLLEGAIESCGHLHAYAAQLVRMIRIS